MTWWDAVKNWYAGKREEPFPTPGPETPDREVKYTGAADWLSKRANLTTVMGSKELAAEWTEKARAQAFFSARVAEGHILDRLRKVSDAFSRGEIGQAEARTELKKFLLREGYDPKQAGLRNLASTARLNLILEQNARMAAAVGQYQAEMDPDMLERFPYLQYHSQTDDRVRDDHGKYNGKVYHKLDPIWKRLRPPRDLRCRCWYEQIDEDTAKEIGISSGEKPPPLPESGFAFDPAHAFEEFDLSLIHDGKFRNQVADTLKREYNMSLGDNFKAFFRREDQEEQEDSEEAPVFDAKFPSVARNEMRKILPGVIIDLAGVKKAEPVNRLNRCLCKVKQETGLEGLKAVMVDSSMKRSTPGSYSAETGILRLNPVHMNDPGIWKKFKVGRHGEYEGLLSNIYAGKEVESVALHELYHSVSERIIAKPGGEAKRKMLVECFERAKREGFSISGHGMDDEHEFFAELKTGKELANRSYPDYIEETLKEFLL